MPKMGYQPHLGKIAQMKLEEPMSGKWLSWEFQEETLMFAKNDRKFSDVVRGDE